MLVKVESVLLIIKIRGGEVLRCRFVRGFVNKKCLKGFKKLNKCAGRVYNV